MSAEDFAEDVRRAWREVRRDPRFVRGTAVPPEEPPSEFVAAHGLNRLAQTMAEAIAETERSLTALGQTIARLTERVALLEQTARREERP